MRCPSTYSLLGDCSQKERRYTQLDIFQLIRPFSRDTDKLCFHLTPSPHSLEEMSQFTKI